jgi:hypothetical protein
MVIYCHSTVILSFCVIKLYYLGNYCGMAVNYHGKEFYNIGFMVANLNTMVIYSEILSLEIVRLNLPRYFYNIGS